MMTAHMRLVLIVIGVLLVSATPTAAVPEAKVIANLDVTVSEVSREELRGILLATRTSLGDVHVEPVLLKSGSVHEALVREITGKTATGLGNYYRSLVFTGKGAMPTTFASEAEVVAYVRAHKGAIGYVSPSTPTDGVKVLVVK